MSVELAGWMLMSTRSQVTNHPDASGSLEVNSFSVSWPTQPRLTPSVTANVAVYQLIHWWCNTLPLPGYNLTATQ